VHQAQGQVEEARRCYASSLKADTKYVSPYAQLARLAAVEKKWDETADWSDKLIKLNPYFSPDVYFFGAVAYLNMNNLSVAEERAREAAKMDPQHRNPRINQVLGVILAQKEDYPGAAENMRSFLKFSPNAPDAEAVRKQLSDVEKILGAKAVAAPAPPNE
jgi:tetratricopeptide (TPR) repeat protein